jgi:Tfp pilus assembly protein PilO
MRFRIKKQVLIFIAAGGVVVAFIVLRWLPLGRMRADLSERQAALTTLMQRGQAKEAELPKLRAQLNELSEELADFDSKVPPDMQLGQFLGKVAALMDEHQLTEQQIAPRDQIESKELVCIPVTMKCTGSLEQIRGFCSALQGLDRAVRIEDFKLVNDSQFTGQVRMETDAIIYYRKTG